MEIPLRDTDEVITLNLNDLPTNAEDIIKILNYEKVPLRYWITLAVEYYRRGLPDTFKLILERSRSEANIDYKDSKRDQMKALDLLASYYVRLTGKEKNANLKSELLSKADQLFNAASKITNPDENHLLARANFWMVQGEKAYHADTLFNSILEQSPNNIPALLGKACIFYNRKEYARSLTYFKQVIRKKPRCPAIVRVCLGYCFLKQGNQDKAIAAFERALTLDPNCVDALVGLAILRINTLEKTDVQEGVQMLGKAYSINRNNPSVLNHLANHFFFKKDYQNARKLAVLAVNATENKTIQAESCYHLARILHVKKDYKRAFSFYEKAAQFASTEFVLPYYGLGQMYIYQNDDIDNAIQCFEKILKVQPDNYEVMKVLGSLYGRFSSPSRQYIAGNYLKKVIEQFPDDFETWIELAQLLEQFHYEGCLQAYINAYNIIKENTAEVSPEISNNIGVLRYKFGNFEAARYEFSEALNRCKRNTEQKKSFNSVLITVTYNLARTFEALYQFDKAENLYKDILRENPKYIDCYLRLGCMARDKNQVNEASDWFIEALHINTNHADAWALLGNLYLAKMNRIPSDEKFEPVLKNLDHASDSYPILALGNIWLEALYYPLKDKNTEEELQNRSLALYSKVAWNDKRYPWASNGIGCVLANKGCIQEAEDIFTQVHEFSPDFCDVWVNIAHIYVEKKQYQSAIQMYKESMKRFCKNHNVEILQYLGRAYFMAEKYEKAKAVFSKARQIAPHNLAIVYNIALVLQKLAQKKFKNYKSNLESISQAVHQLKLSQKYFQYLAAHGNRTSFDLTSADFEAKQCQNLLSQIPGVLLRKKIEESELLRLGQPDKEVSIRMLKAKKETSLSKTSTLSKSSKEKNSCQKHTLNFRDLVSDKPNKKRKSVSWRIPEVEHKL